MVRGVEFEEQEYTKKRSRGNKKRPLLVRWSLKLPFISTKGQANGFLIAVAVLFFLSSAAVIMSVFGGGLTQTEPTYIEDIPPEQRDELPEEFRDSLPSRRD